MLTDDEKRELIAIPRPVVPFGPKGVPEDQATANYLRKVVEKIDFKYANLGGSNVTATVRKLLLDAADALEGALTGSKTPPLGKRLDPEFRAQLVDFAAGTIQDVWNDVPGGVDAITLAQNVVGAQGFAWIARGFPVVPDV